MSGPRVEKRYRYVDEDGNPLYEVERLVPKGFRQRRWLDGEWVYRLEGVRRVLYKLPDVLAAKAEGRWIFVTEGEKDAENLAATGRVTTTAPGGAGKWLDEYTEMLRGAKVALFADNDFEGARHVLKVAVELDPVVAALKIYQPPQGFKDVSEQLAKEGGKLRAIPFDRAAWQEVLGQTNGHVNGNGRRKLMVMSVKDFCARPAPAKDERLLGPLLWRKCRHVVGAHTGEGKTTMACQLCHAVLTGEPFLHPKWRGAGERVLYVNLEQGEERTKQRFREVGLDGVDGIDLIHEPDGLALDRNPEEVKQVEGILRDGRYDLVVFDPFYQLTEGDEVDQVEAKKMSRLVDGLAREYGFASLVPMHRRKPVGPVVNHRQYTIHEIAGISTWLRNAEVVLGLQTVNHGYSWLHWFKDRPGFLPAVGSHWALAFDAETHTYHRTEERDAVRNRLRPLLKDQPGLTAQEIAEELGCAVSTAQSALRSVNARPEPGAPKSDPFCRWQLGEWPVAQLAMDEPTEEASDGG